MPCEFVVKVIAKHGHVRWEKDKNGGLHCYLTNEPISEAANKELLSSIAQAVGVSLSKVVLVHGAQDHVKLIKISDHAITFDHVLEGLGFNKIV